VEARPTRAAPVLVGTSLRKVVTSTACPPASTVTVPVVPVGEHALEEPREHCTCSGVAGVATSNSSGYLPLPAAAAGRAPRTPTIQERMARPAPSVDEDAQQPVGGTQAQARASAPRDSDHAPSLSRNGRALRRGGRAAAPRAGAAPCWSSRRFTAGPARGPDSVRMRPGPAPPPPSPQPAGRPRGSGPPLLCARALPGLASPRHVPRRPPGRRFRRGLRSAVAAPRTTTSDATASRRRPPAVAQGGEPPSAAAQAGPIAPESGLPVRSRRGPPPAATAHPVGASQSRTRRPPNRQRRAAPREPEARHRGEAHEDRRRAPRGPPAHGAGQDPGPRSAGPGATTSPVASQATAPRRWSRGAPRRGAGSGSRRHHPAVGGRGEEDRRRGRREHAPGGCAVAQGAAPAPRRGVRIVDGRRAAPAPPAAPPPSPSRRPATRASAPARYPDRTWPQAEHVEPAPRIQASDARQRQRRRQAARLRPGDRRPRPPSGTGARRRGAPPRCAPVPPRPRRPRRHPRRQPAADQRQTTEHARFSACSATFTAWKPRQPQAARVVRRVVSA